MTNSGLTSRLRQQSRRTGLAVGFAMALTIAFCIGGFVVIYAQIDPFTRDFITVPTPTATARPTEAARAVSNDNENDAQDESTETPPADEPTATESVAAPTPTPDGFQADYQSNAETSVNFRSGPGTENEVVQVLNAGTDLMATGEEGTDDSGTVWLEFELENGTSGWIREIDAVPSS